MHPYRTAHVPEAPPPRPELAPDPDIAPVLCVTLAASLARVLWAWHLRFFDREASLAFATALLCAALLVPAARWAGRRLRARLGRQLRRAGTPPVRVRGEDDRSLLRSSEDPLIMRLHRDDLALVRQQFLKTPAP